MNKKANALLVLILFLVVGVAIYVYLSGADYKEILKNITQSNPQEILKNITGNTNLTLVHSSIKIASWNLEIFGDSKASNPTLMESYKKVIENYDIIFVQEIRDADASSFDSLCAMMVGYKCKISSRAGRSISKEQYGLIYKDNLKLIGFVDYNPDSLDRWERPPFVAYFDGNLYNFSLYNIHVKPEDVKSELAALENDASIKSAISQNNPLAILGDLNADCDYYNAGSEPELDSLVWLINDNQDTTSGNSNCAYDRILVTNSLSKKVIDSGIDKSTTTESDHYLIFFEIRTY